MCQTSVLYFIIIMGILIFIETHTMCVCSLNIENLTLDAHVLRLFDINFISHIYKYDNRLNRRRLLFKTTY